MDVKGLAVGVELAVGEIEGSTAVVNKVVVGTVIVAGTEVADADKGVGLVDKVGTVQPPASKHTRSKRSRLFCLIMILNILTSSCR